MSDDKRIRIFDTTLRDGEQSPGCSMNLAEKLVLARQLAKLGVDVIEAGFAIASEGDFEAVKAIAAEIGDVSIASLARTSREDVEKAARALERAKRPRIHTFIATSDIHLQHKLKMGREQVLEEVDRAVRQARGYVDDVEFSAEDATRSSWDYLVQVFGAAVQAGATTLNVPDTVGYTTPTEYGELIRFLLGNVPGIDTVTVSAHCHDDLGLAVANSLAAVEAGARQVECTITGIGERAGNCALEELVMAVRTRPERYGATPAVRTPRLYGAARLLSTLIAQPIARNKAIVGDNAFAHESGIHQHGMIADRSTYEIMKPEDVGVPGSQLVLGKHSGRAVIRERLGTLGYDADEATLDAVFVAFKQLADRKREVYDADLEALWLGVDPSAQGPWSLEAMHVTTAVGSRVRPTATVTLRDIDGRHAHAAALGEGPVDAIANGIAQATGLRFDLREFNVRSLTSGVDAQGQARVRVAPDGREYRGRAVSTDVIEASARALLEVANRITACARARAERLQRTGT
jgi:2-isopropylmalate synthase